MNDTPGAYVDFDRDDIIPPSGGTRKFHYRWISKGLRGGSSSQLALVVLPKSMASLTRPTDIRDQEAHLEILKVFGRVWRWHGTGSDGLAQRGKVFGL
ncbi:hypothetical protein Tco_1456240 [Tanacetum coccineum]